MTIRVRRVTMSALAAAAASLFIVVSERPADAGLVRVVRSGRDVFIRGGQLPDDVTLGVGPRGQLRVSSADPDTTIGEGTLTDIDVLRSDTIYLLLDGGGNSVDVTALPQVRRLVVIGGSGDDTLRLSGSSLQTDVHFDGQGGGDRLDLTGTVEGDLVAIMGEGGDSVTVTGGRVDGSCVMELGSGASGNSFVADGATFGQTLTVTGGEQSDAVALRNCSVFRMMRSTLDFGSDSVEFSGGTILRGGFVVDTGDGADALTLGSASARGRAKVLTGDGADSVFASGFLAARRIEIELGAGNDSIEFDTGAPTQTPSGARISGGADGDALIGVAPRLAVIVSFEELR